MNIEDMMIKGMVDYYAKTYPYISGNSMVQYFIDAAAYAGLDLEVSA